MSRPDLPRIKPTNHHPTETSSMDRKEPGPWFAVIVFVGFVAFVGAALWLGVATARWIG